MGDISDVIDIDSIADELEYLYGTKQAIADAINEVGESQGITVTSADTFRSYADKIKKFGQCEVGKISVRTTPLYDEEIGTYQTFEAPEGKVWKEVKVHIDAWSAVTQEVDPLIISENGFYDINEMSASKFAFSEVQNPTGNPKQKGYFEKIKGKYYPTEDTEVVESKTYYVEDKTKEYETASSFIINVQRAGAAPFTCDFCDEAGNVIEHHEGIPYGGWCSYEGVTPVSSSGLRFQGWNPAPNNIQTNMKCYPKFFEPRIDDQEWTESWAEIVATHGENMPIGAWKRLPLTDNVVDLSSLQPGKSITISAAPVMRKVYNGEDVSTSTFVSMNLPIRDLDTSVVVMYGQNADWPEGTWESWTECDVNPYSGDPNLPRINLRKFLNEHFIKLIPDYIRQFIVPVTKYTYCIDPSQRTWSKEYATQDYIWVPSTRELNGGHQDDLIVRGCWDGIYNGQELKASRGPIYSDVYKDTPDRQVPEWLRPTSAPMNYGCRDSTAGGGGYTAGPRGCAVVRNYGYDGTIAPVHGTSLDFLIGFCL